MYGWGLGNDGHFAYWTVSAHFAYCLVISPTTWTVRLQIALHFINKTTKINQV